MGLLETAAGPAPGAMAELGELILKARDFSISAEEEFKLGELFDFATQNFPMVNLFYVRPALDYLFLSSFKEAVSPGYTKRVQKRRLKEYRQRSIAPKPLPTAQAIADLLE